jgi:hypothetical protein
MVFVPWPPKALGQGTAVGLTNVPVDGINGGLNINIAVLVPAGGTNILCFSNGILRAIQ